VAGLALAALLDLSLIAADPARVTSQADARTDSERRLVAVGDVHGNDEGFAAILRRAGLIDESNRWTGGTATFVQTGDVLDRGLGARRTLDLLIALERDAGRGKGRVVPLLGNHEVMNLLGETRDVNPELYGQFTDNRSDARRESAWSSYARLGSAQKNAAGELLSPYNQTRDDWMATHPSGYIEYREAFAPRGRYGAWLRQRDIAIKIGDTIFMHAGPGTEPAARSVNELNDTARREIARFDRFVQTIVDRKLALPFFSLQEIIAVAANQLTIANAFVEAQRTDRDAPRPALTFDELREAQAIIDIGTWSLLAVQGPLWIRGYAMWPESDRDKVAALLEPYGARRLVVGHTPQPKGIAQRFGGLAYVIDTGMLASVYKGMPSALEIVGDRVTAIYLDSQQQLTQPQVAHAGGGPRL
jgi:hypothetical protein